MSMAATGNETIAASAAEALAGAASAGPLADGAGQALARKLVGDPKHYSNLARGRGRGATQVLDLN